MEQLPCRGAKDNDEAGTGSAAADRACDRRHDDRKGYGFGIGILISTKRADTGAAASLDSEPEGRGED